MPTSGERRQVEAMAGYGIPEADIARVLGIDPKTLRKHYRDELDTGHVIANAKVAESLFRKATGDHRQSVTAAIFWLKTRAGWREGALLPPGADGLRDAAPTSDLEVLKRRIESVTLRASVTPMSDNEVARRLIFVQRKLEEEGGADISPSTSPPGPGGQSGS